MVVQDLQQQLKTCQDELQRMLLETQIRCAPQSCPSCIQPGPWYDPAVHSLVAIELVTAWQMLASPQKP